MAVIGLEDLATGCFGSGPAEPSINDLADVPLSVTVSEWLTEWLLGLAVDDEVERTIDRASALIEAELSDGLGYLVRVNKFDVGGVPYLPDGQVLTLIGPGREPIDALARHMSPREFNAAVPAGAINQSCYIWIARYDGKTYSAKQQIGTAAALEKRAWREMQHRSLLGGEALEVVRRVDPIIVALEWQEANARLQAREVNAAKKASIAALTAELQRAQDDFNRAYADYRRAAERAGREARLLRALQVVETVTGLARTALEARGVTTGRPGAAPNEPSSLESQRSRTESRLSAHKTYAEVIIMRMESYRVPISDLQRQLRNEYSSLRMHPPRIQLPPWPATGELMPDPAGGGSILP
jgi:hypothetical protein